MHQIIVGVRIDGGGDPEFFGWDEVNEYIRHGMRVLSVEPGGYFNGELDENGRQSQVWSATVFLDDDGIDH
jgi:hypothetical protein